MDTRTQELRALSVLVLASCMTPFILGQMSPTLGLLTIGILFPIWFDLPFESIRNHKLWKGFTFASFVLFLISRFLEFEWFVSIIILVLFSIVFEIYGERRKRAHIRILSLLSFFIVIAQLRVDQGFPLFLGILIFFFGVGVTLVRFRQIRLAEQFGLKCLDWKHVLKTVSLLFLVLLPASMVLFWTLPRTHTSLQPFSLRDGNFISAFSDRVSLNDIGTISQSNRHVMDLTPLNGFPVPTPYLTGRIFDRYKHGLWSSTTERHRSWRFPDERGMIPIVKLSTPGAEKKYEISMRPLKGNPIFFFPSTTEIEIHRTLLIERDIKHIYHPSRNPHIQTYILHCDDKRRDPEPSSKLMPTYLQLPENGDYFKEKALEMLGPDYETLSVGEKIASLFSYFSRHFSYTLQINNIDKGDPLIHFLDVSRKGHCELFASSTALILRASGIPTRLVTGFLLPEMINESFYHVTEASAHAWVEVWTGKGWMTFDPTGAARLEPTSWFDKNLAVLNHAWDEWVIKWDFSSQREFFQKTYAFFSSQKFAQTGLILSLSAAMFLLLFFLREPLKSWLTKHTLIDRFQSIMETRFPRKGEAKTWIAYIDSLPIETTFHNLLVSWVDQYYHMTFSSKGDPSARRHLEKTLKKIRNITEEQVQDAPNKSN